MEAAVPMGPSALREAIASERVVVGALRDVRVSLTRFTLARLRAEFEEGKRASFAKHSVALNKTALFVQA